MVVGGCNSNEYLMRDVMGEVIRPGGVWWWCLCIARMCQVRVSLVIWSVEVRYYDS